MVLRNLALLLLLIVSPSAALIDCSKSNSCFGEPLNCDPDTDCLSFFHFDSQGHVSLFLRHFKDSEHYAAFPVDRHPDDLIEYNICLPHKGQRIRALTLLGEPVNILDEDSDGVVQKISEDYFRCQFDATPDLLYKIQKGQIQLSRGSNAQNLVIQNGSRIYNVQTIPSSSPEEGVIPVTYPIAAAVSTGLQDDVYTSDDRQEVSDAMSRLPKTSGSNKEDLEMEKLLHSTPRHRDESERREEDREEDSEASEDENEDVRRPDRHQNHKSKSSRPTRYENDEDVEDDDVDMDQEEEDYRPYGKKNERPTLRHHHDEDADEEDFEDVDDEPKRGRNNNRRRQDEEDEEDEKPRRRNSSNKNKKEEDDYESEDDNVYDDEDNATRCNFVLATLPLVILKFFF